MQKIAVVLITLGFLGGALVGSLDPERIDWTQFVPCLLVACIGVGFARWSARQQATQAHLLEANIRDIDASIRSIAQGARELREQHSEATVYDLPEAIDRRFAQPLQRFVGARESIAHVYGVQAYADVMSEFAAGERYLNRVWSASAEGYVDEAETYLDKACHQFESAQQQLTDLAQGGD